MLIKVLCACGTKFSFEVEPIHGRMPMRLNCPSCNADATDLANASIAEQLAPAAAAPASRPEPPKARIRTATAALPGVASPAPPPAAEPARLHVRSAAPPTAVPIAAAGAETGSAGEVCSHHPNVAAVEHCRVCGKPMCEKCMELFGYACSVFCRTRAEREKIVLPRYARQRSVIEAEARARTRLLAMIAGGVAVLLLGVWVWWAFFGTKPRVVYSLKIPRAERGTVYEMLSATELLGIQESRLRLLDPDNGNEIWSTPLEVSRSAGFEGFPPISPAVRPAAGATPETAAGKLAADAASAATSQADSETTEANDEDDAWDLVSYRAPKLLTANEVLWFRFPDRLAAYDRKTGARKQEIALAQPVLDLVQNESGMVVLSGDERSSRTLTLISLPGGTVKTQLLARPATPPPAARGAAGLRVPVASEEGVDSDDFAPPRDDFLAAGGSVVQFKTRLLERKMVTREAMKPKPEKSIVEGGNLSAGQSLDAAQELLNEMHRSATGGVIEEDVSRYEVTLKRMLGAEVPAWTGEVIGPPNFFPLKTVDVLFGAKELIVFNKSNQRRWDARLTYSLPRELLLGFGDARNAPCVETADALYVFDQGMLTCFELGSGLARWRVTSVGISRVQFDAEGGVYVNTTTASPDVIDYPQQINIYEKPRPVIMKVEAATGKTLWKVANIADQCILSGPYVYAARSSSGTFANATHFNLYRLDPATGKERWHYYSDHWPRNTGYHGTRFMLQWKDELQLFNYLTL